MVLMAGKTRWMTSRRALAIKLAEKADQAGGGKGWVYLKDVRAWGETDGWQAEAKRMGLVMGGYPEWYSAVLVELHEAGYLHPTSRGKYKKTGLWPEALELVKEFEDIMQTMPDRVSSIHTPRWDDSRWVAAEIVSSWPKDKPLLVSAVKMEARRRGVEDTDAVGRAVADFNCSYGVLKRVGRGRYEKLEGWKGVDKALQEREEKKKKVVEEALGKGMITLHKGSLSPIEDDPTPPTLPGFVSGKEPSVELVDTPIGPRPPAIITIDDLIAHAEALARQVVEWHGKYQQAAGMLRMKEADVEAAMRMLSGMEEQVMQKNAELEEAKGELITLQKQYEVAMDRARKAPIIPMINSRVTEEQGLDDDKPPTNGGGAAA